MRRNSVPMIVSLTVLALAACGGPGQQTTTTEGPTATSSTRSTTPPTSTTTSSADTSTTSSEVEEFRDPGDLLVVGDWGSGTLPQGAVAGAMSRYAEDRDIAAILTTGDNFYSNDSEFLMQPFGWATEAEIPFWVTWGNHDVESLERIDAVNDVFDSPPRWAKYEWGPTDVVVLDSNQITSPQQAAFFLNALAGSSRPTVIVMHHPPYSCSRHGSTTDIVNQVVSVLDDDVVLVLSGHDHSYQRFERNGITYVVSGGGGNTLYPIDDCPANHPELLAGAELHHFVALDQSADDIELVAINVNGEVIDEMAMDLP